MEAEVGILRDHADKFQLDGDVKAVLEELREGMRERANIEALLEEAVHR